jgi:hypothetical protein
VWSVGALGDLPNHTRSPGAKAAGRGAGPALSPALVRGGAMVLARVYGGLGVGRTRAISRSHTRTLTVPASILTPATVLGALRAIWSAKQGESDHFEPRPSAVSVVLCEISVGSEKAIRTR